MVSFKQIFIDTKRHEDAEDDARQLLQRLQSGQSDDVGVGDPMLLAEGYDQTPMTRIAELFGEAFADELAKAPSGKWAGPLKSSFGLHLVRVTGAENAHVLPFEAVHDAVQREWFAQHRDAALDAEYQKLRAKYNIQVAYPSKIGVPQ